MINPSQFDSLNVGTVIQALEEDAHEFKSLMIKKNASSDFKPMIMKEIQSLITRHMKTLNAFLNTKNLIAGGSIHFGISDTPSKIEDGVELKGKDQDVLRNAIDQGFRNMDPDFHGALDIKFLKLNNNKYRFRVTVMPGPNAVYYMSNINTIAYHRQQGRSIPLTAQQIKRRQKIQNRQEENENEIQHIIDALAVVKLRKYKQRLSRTRDISDKIDLVKTVIELFELDDTYGINFLRALMELYSFVSSPRHHQSKELTNLLCGNLRDCLLAFRLSMLDSDASEMMEIAFNITYDGAKYCKNYEIFQSGLILLCMVRCIFPKINDRLDDLNETLQKLEWDEKDKSNKAIRWISLWMEVHYGPPKLRNYKKQCKAEDMMYAAKIDWY